MKNQLILLLLICTLFAKAQFKNATLTLLNGKIIEVRITQAHPNFITAIVKGKVKVINADSLASFRFEGNDYLSLKVNGRSTCEFAIKLKTLDEFELYGWRELFNPSTEDGYTPDPINLYKFIKRAVDDRTRVFEFSKEGIEQIPFLNCEGMMKELLKNNVSSSNLYELLEKYDRDCGIEMRSK